METNSLEGPVFWSQGAIAELARAQPLHQTVQGILLASKALLLTYEIG